MRPHREGEDGGPSRKESRLRRTPKGRNGDPNRFSGSGIHFKAKIIGTERVLDARGNRMCQGALQRLKAAVKTSGDHKQRIILNVSLNGIIIKDEKSGEILHHHPIHKISFISQDTGDNRAFGYVFGCPQTGHDFFGIKTEKMASQVVLTLRDLFLAALELKKKEMEEEEVPAAEVSPECGTSSKRTVADNCQRTERILSEELPYSDKPPDESNAAAAENALLKYSVDSLQQGISHMDRSIARGFGFSFSEDDVSESSVNSIPASFQFKMDKLASLYHETMSLSSRSSSTSEYACASEFQEEDKRDVGASSEHTSEDASSPRQEDKYAVFLEDIDALPSVFDNPDITLQPIVTPRPRTPVEEDHKEASDAPTSAPVAFAELDPLGSQPYVDRKDFFHELKKPPKKALKDLTDSAELFSSRLSADLCHNTENGLPKGTAAFQSFNMPPPPFNPFADPPALPPKRPSLFPDPSEEVPWGHRSPFNPFVSDECLDIPPPSSPPPPPPPRLPSKAAAPCTPPPPPRPPGRPSAPLPAWLSFDQEEVHPAPPLPSPARKFSQTDTPPCSPAWNCPTVASPHLEVGAEVFFPEIVGDSPRFERWSSKQPSENVERGFNRNGGGLPQTPENDTKNISRNGGGLPPEGAASPPLPPKPGQSDASSSSSLVSASSNGARSSSSFVFSSSDECRRAGSGGEHLVSSGEHALSPDSIFRRKGDPFADDFFLSLPKKLNDRACFRDFKPSA